MTSVVGVLCKDGVVIGSDSAVTFTDGARMRTIEQQSSEKLVVLGKDIIVAGTGEVGYTQRLLHVISTQWVPSLSGREPPMDASTSLAERMISNFKRTEVPRPAPWLSLVGFYSDGAFVLLELPGSLQPELKTKDLWYTSSGSGQTLTDPILALIRDVFWSDGQPNVQDGAFAVTWALEHAIAHNPGGVGGPPQIAVLEKPSWRKFVEARKLPREEVGMHSASVAAAKEHLRGYVKTLHSVNVPAIPSMAPKAT